MLSFDHYITTKPHSIRAVFVSDLHLSAHTPALNTAFVHFIYNLSVLPKLDHLFILGDFLDAWIGDDDYCKTNHHWLAVIITTLNTLKSCNRYLMTGNRDFMIGKKLCHAMNVKFINEPYLFEFEGKIYRLEHGDRLCTDDIGYQRYRTIIQNPISKKLLATLPLSVRYKLAGNIQKQSNNQKNYKNQKIMDVNMTAVHQALADIDTLIHGHTHRPAIHFYDNKQRVVLGDWQHQNGKVNAVIGLISDDGVVNLANYQDSL